MGARRRLIWWASFAAFGLIGVTWALSIAPMGGPDEIAHSRRAVAVARGQLGGETVWVDSPFLRWPRTEVTIPEGYAQGFPIGNELTQCWVNDARVPTSCAPRPPSASGPLMRTYTYVGAYQPGYYLVVGLPSRWLPPSSGIYAMRIVSALLVAALLASAVVSFAELARGPWTVVGLAAALTPTVLYLAGSINPNSVEIAAAVALWGALLALWRARGPAPDRLLARVGVAAVVLACTRPTSPLLLLAVVVAASAFEASRERSAELWASNRARVLAGVVGLVVAANLVFVLVNRSLTRVIVTGEIPGSHLDVARRAVDLTPGWLDEALGSLSWLGYGSVGLPLPVRWLWWATIAAVALLGLVRGTNRQRAVVVLVAAAGVVGPIAATVLKPEVAWQGRYALPILVGVPILAGLAADRGTRSAPWGQRERWAASALLAAIAACQVAAHQQLMVRNLLGLPNRLLRGILHAPWGGPVSPLVLLAMAGLGSLGFLALALAGVWRPGGEPTSEADRSVEPAGRG